MINRLEEIKKKGFSMATEQPEYNNIDFSKIKVGMKTLDDAIINLDGNFKKTDSRFGDKDFVLKSIKNANYVDMRNISDFYYKTSGIYNRLCRYLAYMYRYDWVVTPYINSNKIKEEDKLLNEFHKVLKFLDDFQIKKFLGEVALKVIKNGCYYGYLIPQQNRIAVQELPIDYCRSRFFVEGVPVVEFNMKFFDDYFRDVGQRMKILKIFPEDFQKGYLLYKKGKLQPEFIGDKSGWYVLDTSKTIKFNINGEDFPGLISVIPAIIDLDLAQALDRKKMAQQLLKIIIQKMPMDKNGDLIFDIDEARELHNNAVRMLGKAIGIDVLTTFADVEVADMADRNSATSVDELAKVERGVFNEAGVSQMQFNTDGNIALEKSILNDEASLYNLIQQFEAFLNKIIKPFNKNEKKMYYRVQILTTTIYNYKEMAKLYKEQTQLGYSKMLPQIALGQTQSSILANAYFENDILDLVHVFIPPLMSSTMNAEALQGGAAEKENGRPEKPDDEKSTKTLQNKESQN